MPQVKYRYRSYMSLDDTHDTVHLEALTAGLPYRFVSVERARNGVAVIGVRNAPSGSAIHLTARWLDEKMVKTLLAWFNHHDEERLDEIGIELDMSVWLTVGLADQEMMPDWRDARSAKGR